MARPMPGGPPPAPTVQRLTIRYAKRGRMRFASHRDVARAIERGVRKAGLPVAYSAGFSPHPRISYSGGAPTGSASEAEYLELAVTRRCVPDDVCRRLDAALPDGIDVVEIVEADARFGGMQLEASEWEVVWSGVPVDVAASAVRKFLAESSVLVERLTSKGSRTLDARAAVLSLAVSADRDAESGSATTQGSGVAGTNPSVACAILRIIVRQLTPAVRPDDILAALGQLSALAPTSPPLVTRLWQGPMSALTVGQTGAQTGMTVVVDGVRPGDPGQPSRPAPAAPPASAASLAPSVSPERRPAAPASVGGTPREPMPEPMPSRVDPVARHEEFPPRSTTDKAMQLEAKSAEQAPAIQV